MANPKSYKYSGQTVAIELGTGDASKIIYTVSGQERVVVIGIHVFSLTAAAQVVTLQDNTPGIVALKLPASWTAGQFTDMAFESGIEMTAGQNLIIKPAAAGPGQFWIVDFYVMGKAA